MRQSTTPTPIFVMIRDIIRARLRTVDAVVSEVHFTIESTLFRLPMMDVNESLPRRLVFQTHPFELLLCPRCEFLENKLNFVYSAVFLQETIGFGFLFVSNSPGLFQAFLPRPPFSLVRITDAPVRSTGKAHPQQRLPRSVCHLASWNCPRAPPMAAKSHG